MMDIIYDVTERTLKIAYPDPEPRGTLLRAMMAGNEGRYELNGLKMGVSLIIGGQEVGNLSYPPEGQKLAASDQEVVLTHRLHWQPDLPVRVEAWCNHLGETLKAEIDFTAPRPASPYPSWNWSGSAWQSPALYPEDGQDYDWDEAAGAWVVVE